jgi:hypothetical protein
MALIRQAGLSFSCLQQASKNMIRLVDVKAFYQIGSLSAFTFTAL